eukprot:6054951-Amphidinium_carterae.1
MTCCFIRWHFIVTQSPPPPLATVPLHFFRPRRQCTGCRPHCWRQWQRQPQKTPSAISHIAFPSTCTCTQNPTIGPPSNGRPWLPSPPSSLTCHDAQPKEDWKDRALPPALVSTCTRWILLDWIEDWLLLLQQH